MFPNQSTLLSYVGRVTEPFWLNEDIHALKILHVSVIDLLITSSSKKIEMLFISCHFINSMHTQIYGVQLIHRENNALGSLQLPHALH